MADRSSGAPVAAWAEGDWRLIAETIPHLVWVAGAEGQTLYFNRRAEDYTGTSGDEGSWEQVVHPDDLDRATHCWEEARRGASGFQEDFRLRRSDGEYRWHSVRSLPMLTEWGVVERWFGTATDIDDRKCLETELSEAQLAASQTATLLSALQEAAPIGIGFVDRAFTIVRMNDELARFVDRPAAEQIGRAVADVVPDLWGQLEPVYRHVLDGQSPVRNIPMTRTLPDGTGPVREWMVSFYPVRVDDEVSGIGVVAVDVTARVQAEGFRSTVMSQVADGVYTLDPDGCLSYLNRAACRMLGWTEAELRGRNVHEAFHVQAHSAGGEPRGCALVGEGTDRRLIRVADEEFVRKDGTTFPVAYSAVPLQVGSRSAGTSVVFRDIGTSTSSSNLIRVLIADADPTSTNELRSMLTRHEGLDVVGMEATVAGTLQVVDRLHPDVVIVDVGLPDAGGIAASLQIKRVAPETGVILLASGYDDVVAAGAIAAGCSGIVDKRRSWVELASAVRAAYHGETTISQAELQQVVHAVRDAWQPGRAEDLTPREREVLVCLTQGLSNQQVATHLGLTVNTVRNHVQRVLYKLDVHSRLEAVVLATREGILDPVA